jgi:hypothetical protein
MALEGARATGQRVSLRGAYNQAHEPEGAEPSR